MTRASVTHEMKQPSLFESATHRPRWEDLPLEVRLRVTRLLSELLSGRIAQPLLTIEAKGGDDE
jgi:hypothetical protein